MPDIASSPCRIVEKNHLISYIYQQHNSLPDGAKRHKESTIPKPACRLGDRANCPADAHGNPCCPHNVTGPAVTASPDVFINGKPALRVGDTGIHAVCCGPNTWACIEGSAKVRVNGIPLVRKGDATRHCGGLGRMIDGSADVMVE